MAGNGRKPRLTASPNGSGRRTTRSSRVAGRERRGRGTLIIIGGREDKEGEKVILRAVAKRAGEGRLVVATVASSVPDELWETYERVFRGLGVRHVWHLDVRVREEAMEPRTVRVLDDASVVFFTGGDQLKITSKIGDTPVYERIREVYEGGGTVAGTSAGASVMPETMLAHGPEEDSHKIREAIKMAPGLGLIDNVIIDQHFAQRGRIGRLLGSVAQNPRTVGIGIDENTAIVVARQRFRVLGENAVYIVDGRQVSYSNLADDDTDCALALFDVRLHVLAQGDSYAFPTRKPAHQPAEVEELAGV